ncbi:uncharacterized protein TNCV_2880061 [Trichonephila clavipes]|uniref:Uncharacterized protein n=1 Tax=Trichonephila clavipes TaxID=2585209 RepID=A0A8X6W1R2_TRICX|nr:uncharacterized protein TNCV_2880061 [Trichonephila clavipes]
MRQAIWAIFLPKLSTDEYPQHGFCPIGEDSWCEFKKAEASGKHKNSLPVAVVEAMRPIFRDLSHPDLLKKCLHGKTQNPNESFHNVIWSRVPKATFVRIETLSFGVYDAICSFNDGNVSKLKMLQKMGAEPGEYSVSALKLLDIGKDYLDARRKLENIKEEKERKKIILRKIRTVLAKNKIVLDPALRLQSFRTPKTQQLVSEVGLNANNKSDGGPVPDSSRKIDRQHECQYGRNEIGLDRQHECQHGRNEIELTASMNANMGEMKSS